MPAVMFFKQPGGVALEHQLFDRSEVAVTEKLAGPQDCEALRIRAGLSHVEPGLFADALNQPGELRSAAGQRHSRFEQAGRDLCGQFFEGAINPSDNLVDEDRKSTRL